jgi:hypothetical protein
VAVVYCLLSIVERVFAASKVTSPERGGLIVTQRADYTSSEWSLLTSAVVTVGLGMLAVSGAGLVGRLRELTTLSRRFSRLSMPIQFTRNELVVALLEDFSAPTSDGQKSFPLAYLTRGDVAGLIMAVVRSRARMLSAREQVGDLLDDRTPWAEADGVKRWMLWIARSVAEASGDRWLGLGRRVNDREASMLDQIATALRISPDLRVPTVAELDALLGPAPYDSGPSI